MFKYKINSNILYFLEGNACKKTANIIKIRNLLVALTFFISSQNVNESLVQLAVGITRASKLIRNLERLYL